MILLDARFWVKRGAAVLLALAAHIKAKGLAMNTENLPSPEMLRKLLAYDPLTGLFTWKPRENVRIQWNARWAGSAAGSYDAKGYVCIQVNRIKYKAHRIAWAVTHGEWPDGEIDHINQIKDDNRIANLRVVSPALNRRNAGMRANNTSGVTGVYYSKKYGFWTAALGGDYLGFHRCKTAAIISRAVAQAAHPDYHQNHGRA